MLEKLKQLQKFWSKDGEFKPLRAIIFFFIILSSICMIMKIFDPDWFSDSFMMNLFMFIGVLIGADTWRANVKTKNGR